MRIVRIAGCRKSACRAQEKPLILPMSVQDIAEAVMELPEKERLDLARRIVASVVAEKDASEEIRQAVAGIEDMVTGKVRGLSETEFRDALK